MTSDLSEFFVVGSRGNLANYVLPFQVPQPPKKVLKGENKGGTPLVILPAHFSNICLSEFPVLLLLCSGHICPSKLSFVVVPCHMTTWSNQTWRAFYLCCWANFL